MDDRNAGAAGEFAGAPPVPPHDERNSSTAAEPHERAGTPSPVPDEAAEITEKFQATEGPRAEGPRAEDGVGAPASSASVPVSLDHQKTVISKNPPSLAPVFSRAGVQDLGRMLIGERLGHFVLEEFVGGGGMGAVFRAADTELGRTVAVKVVSGVHNDEETLRRFKNEGQSAARLDHHNIARVYYVGEDKGWNYIVFEFINGVNVRDLVEHRGPLPLEEAISYTLQVAEALDHASQRDVVHRDIKPSNVLVMQDGTVKLVDMGLARLHQVESATDDLTASGVTLGTFDYISPEQARNPRNADVRSDLYSLGCTLFYMLTGRPPFPDGTVLQKLLSHSSDAPPDPRDLRHDLPDDLCDLVHKLLAKNPADRFQTPAELIARLLHITNALGLTLSRRPTAMLVSSTHPTLSRLEYHLPWIVPTALLMLVVLFVDAFSTSRPFTVRRPTLLPAVKRTAQSPATPAPLRTDDEPKRDRPDPEASSPTTAAPAPSTVSPSTTPAVAEALPMPPTENTGSGEPTDPGSATAPPNELAQLTGEPFDGFALQPAVVSAEFQGATASASVIPRPSSSDVGSASAEPESIDTGPVTIVRAIVAPGLENPPRDASVCTTLAAAFQRAGEFDTIEAIELWYDGELPEGTIQAPVHEEPLVIRAGEGYKPVVVFRPEAGSLSGRMIELTGGQTEWEGVHFRMELPVEPSERWALFALRGVEGLKLQNCTLTIVNASDAGQIRQQNVAFFELEQQPAANRMNMGMEMGMGMDEGMTPSMSETSPVIELRNCAARGQASLLRADLVYPFELHWTGGLFISTERFFQLGGSLDRDNWDNMVQLELQDVTAVADRGFGLVNIDSRGPVVAELNLNLVDCIVAMNFSAPLLEHRGVPSRKAAEDSLQTLSGRGNFYPANNPGAEPPSLLAQSQRRVRWLVTTATGDSFSYLFKDKDAEWYQEKGARENVPWTSPLPVSKPYHLHTKWDYQIEAPSSAREAGFDFDALPAFPDAGSAARTNSEAATSSTSTGMR